MVVKKSNLDKRSRVIELTEKGNAELDEYINDIEKDLGATSPDVDYAIEVLNRFLNKII